MSPQQLQPRLLAAWLADARRPSPVLLDVREPWELERCLIAGSRAIVMRSIPERLDELDRHAPTVLICHHGVRSMQVAGFLARNGFAELYNLSGGVDAWARDVDPTMATY